MFQRKSQENLAHVSQFTSRSMCESSLSMRNTFQTFMLLLYVETYKPPSISDVTCNSLSIIMII